MPTLTKTIYRTILHMCLVSWVTCQHEPNTEDSEIYIHRLLDPLCDPSIPWIRIWYHMLLHLSDSCTHCSSARLFPRHRHDWQIPSRICFARVHAHVPWFRRVSRYAMSIGKKSLPYWRRVKTRWQWARSNDQLTILSYPHLRWQSYCTLNWLPIFMLTSIICLHFQATTAVLLGISGIMDAPHRWVTDCDPSSEHSHDFLFMSTCWSSDSINAFDTV